MSDVAKSTIEGWGEALKAKDPGTWSHCKRVAAFATVLARALKLDEGEVRAIACGALLHEIGKLEIPEAILRKPAVLTAEEISRYSAFLDVVLKRYEDASRQLFENTKAFKGVSRDCPARRAPCFP